MPWSSFTLLNMWIQPSESQSHNPYWIMTTQVNDFAPYSVAPTDLSKSNYSWNMILRKNRWHRDSPPGLYLTSPPTNPYQMRTLAHWQITYTFALNKLLSLFWEHIETHLKKKTLKVGNTYYGKCICFHPIKLSK